MGMEPKEKHNDPERGLHHPRSLSGNSESLSNGLCNAFLSTKAFFHARTLTESQHKRTCAFPLRPIKLGQQVDCHSRNEPVRRIATGFQTRVRAIVNSVRGDLEKEQMEMYSWRRILYKHFPIAY